MSDRSFANGSAHDLSPHAGFVDPILAHRRSRFIAEAAQTLAVNDSALWRQQWARGGGSDDEPDSRANVAEEAGWPRHPSAELFNSLYLTDSLSARVVEFMAKECWQVQPWPKDGEEENDETPFLESFWELGRTLQGGDENWFEADEGHPLFHDLQELDVVAGINSYGVLFTGYDDDDDLSKPVAGLEELGTRPQADKKADAHPSFSANGNGQSGGKLRWQLVRNQAKTKGRKVLFNQALPETLAKIAAWETNPHSPRYQMPTHYQINQIDPNIPWVGSLPPTRTLTVHWTRITVHFADWHHHPRPGGGRILANSRMRSVLPDLLGSRKINAASEVAFWRNAMLKIFLETHPQMGGDVLWNRRETEDEFENMMNGLQQWMFLRGMHANAVAPAVVDPTPHQLAKIQRICIKNGWPTRSFMGNEIGQLASENDKLQHKDRVKERQFNVLSPFVVAQAINRYILVGVLEEPTNKTYGLGWPPVGTQDEEKKAKVFATRMQGLAAAIGGNVTSVIPERGLLVDEMGVPEDRAEGYLEEAEQAIAEEEEQAAALADEHGMIPEAPPGFKHPEPDPGPEAVKVRPGEKVVFPKKPAFNYSPDQQRDEEGKWEGGGGDVHPNPQAAFPHLAHLLNGTKAVHAVGLTEKAAKEKVQELRDKGVRASLMKDPKTGKRFVFNHDADWVPVAEDVDDDDEITVHAFCATGEGGGVDPSCSPGGGGGTRSAGEHPPGTAERTRELQAHRNTGGADHAADVDAHVTALGKSMSLAALKAHAAELGISGVYAGTNKTDTLLRIKNHLTAGHRAADRGVV